MKVDPFLEKIYQRYAEYKKGNGGSVHEMLKPLGYTLAEKESSFNPNAKGASLKNGDYAFGLWQMTGPAFADVQKKFPGLVSSRSNPEDAALAGLALIESNLNRYGGDPKAAALAHLGGHGAVLKYKQGKTVADPLAKTDTIKYAEDVLVKLQKYLPTFKVTGSSAPAPVEQRVIVNNTPINQPLPQLKEPERYSDLLAKKLKEYQDSKVNNMGYGTYTPTDMEAVKGMVEPATTIKSSEGAHPFWFNFGNAFGGSNAAPAQKSKSIFDWFGQ